MKHLLFLTLSILLIISSSAQTIKLTGRITDDKNEAIPFATISLIGKSQGVVANVNGEFQFSVSANSNRDTLIISSLGFNAIKKSIKNLSSYSNLVFQLQEQIIELNQIRVESKKIPSAREFIELAIKNIPNNYPQKPFVMEGFYRDHKKENGQYVGLFEAAIQISDKGYDSPKNKHRLKEQVYLNEIRQTKKVKYKADLYTNDNILELLLLQNDVRYVKGGLDSSEIYEFDGFSTINNREVAVIKTKGPWTTYLYIDIENYAIHFVERDAKWDELVKNEWLMNDSVKNSVNWVRMKLQFKEFGGKYYPIYMNYHTSVDGLEVGSNKKLFTSISHQEMLINEVKLGKPKDLDKSKLMNVNTILYVQERPYNKAFWDSYNIIKESKLDKQIIEDLSKGSSKGEIFESKTSEEGN